MPIPSGCCSRLAFRCVRFPAAVLSLRFYRRAGFPVPSVRQSVVRSGFPLCVRFPAAALGLRFYRRAGFPVPSGQSFVRALRCASVSRQRPSACGFPPCRISRSVRPAVSRSFGLSVVHPFPGSGPRLAVFRRAGFPVPSVRQSVVRSGFPLCVRFPAASLGLRFFRRAGFPVPWGSRTYRTLCRPLSLPLLSLLPLSAFFSLCRFSLSAAPLCLLLSLQPHSLLPSRLYRCGRRLAGII